MIHRHKVLFALAILLTTSLCQAADRPNIVWILSEDNSIHYLNLYGRPLGKTPAIEALAAEGIVFNHAFSNAPVCSVARTTLMSGMYAPRIGFQYHRRMQLANLPSGADLFPAYLRKAGYYTTNRSKKDYNVVEGKVWDESSRKASWRNRPSSDTPFFHMQTTGVSHESSLHFKAAEMKRDGALKTNPKDVKVAPYHPDTPTFRFTYARYFDRMKVVDADVAKIVGQLKQDGLLENTIIFYFGDHGGVLPRSKGYVYESGLHVPLVVRVPQKWRKHVGRQAGTRADGFVNFIDFGPTVLNLAGVDVPKTMDGQPFLGPNVEASEVDKRDETFGYADRFDEKYDFSRSLRVGRYKYIRNYQAFYPDALQNNYRYRMLAYAEWRKLYQEGKLNKAQSEFFEPKPVEALYDVVADPHEINNLARSEKHSDVLLDLRERLKKHVKSLPDLSFYPESEMVERALGDGAAFGQNHKSQIARAVDTADLSLLAAKEALPKLRAAMESKDHLERYWALVAASCFGKQAASLVATAKPLTSDQNSMIRVRAAEFLALADNVDPAPVMIDVLRNTESTVEALTVLNSVVFLRDRQPSFDFRVQQSDLKVKLQQITWRFDYLNETK